MLAKLLAVFTIVPLLELLVLIPLGQQIGLWPTIAIVVITAVVGAWFGRREWNDAWARIRADLASGRMPAESVLDGLAVAIACAFLVTPGILTDITGLILLIPATRAPFKRLVRQRFTNMLQNPDMTVIDLTAGVGRWNQDDIIDITPPASSNQNVGHIDAH